MAIGIFRVTIFFAKHGSILAFGNTRRLRFRLEVSVEGNVVDVHFVFVLLSRFFLEHDAL